MKTTMTTIQFHFSKCISAENTFAAVRLDSFQRNVKTCEKARFIGGRLPMTKRRGNFVIVLAVLVAVSSNKCYMTGCYIAAAQDLTH